MLIYLLLGNTNANTPLNPNQENCSMVFLVLPIMRQVAKVKPIACFNTSNYKYSS